MCIATIQSVTKHKHERPFNCLFTYNRIINQILYSCEFSLLSHFYPLVVPDLQYSQVHLLLHKLLQMYNNRLFIRILPVTMF